MFNRVILGLVFIASLVWVVWVGFDITSDSNNYDPRSLFGGEDQELLIITRSSEVQFNQLNAFSEAPLYSLVASLPDSSYHQAYLSLKRAHLLLTNEVNWKEATIKKVFQLQSPEFTGRGTFKIGEYEGRYHKRKLYISKPGIQPHEQLADPFVYDKKASASIIRFNEASHILNFSDIYFKSDGQINFITKDENIKQGKQVKDEVLFAGIVTRNFDSYHFYERDYYATLDSTFANGPMFQWMLNGFVELNYGGERVFISDFIGGQDPILILNDLQQTLDTNVFNFQLTHDFPSKGSKYTVKYLEDAVVISEKPSLCDRVISDYRLGNTIALSSEVRDRVFGHLPQSVSERSVEGESAMSRAVYQGKLLETHTGTSQQETLASNQETISISCGFDIKDFATLRGNGKIIALSKSGEIAQFKSGEKSWSFKLEEQPFGEIQLVDLHGTGEQFALLNTPSAIHLWNESGQYANGFPIKHDGEAKNEVKFYRWKSKSYFLLIGNDNKILHYDSQGRELNIIPVTAQLRTKRALDVWSSQGRLFVGIPNENSFIMYDMDRKRVHREFNIPAISHTLKAPNQLFHYAIENRTLVKYDQKGVKSEFMTLNSPVLLGISNQESTPTLIVKDGNSVKLFNTEGVPYAEISLSFNEVEDIFVFTSNNGKTYVGLIDGLENNVYLYGTDGQAILNKSLEGQSKIRLDIDGSVKRITTIVDQFVIQYFED